MTSYEISVRIPAPAEKVFPFLITPEYAEWEALNEGAVSAKARIEKQDTDKIVLVIDRTDHSRGAKGKITSKTERNVVTQKWDLAAMRNSWSVRVPGMELLVDIKGSMWVEAQGGACVICEKGSAHIKVPLIGRIVEKGIVDDIRKNFLLKNKFFQEKLG